MSGKYYLIGIVLTTAALVATMVAYPHLPNTIATHWNMQNQPNGYSPKWSLFLIGPGLMAAMMLLMYFLPWLSPRNFEVDSFRSAYLQIMLILICLLGYLYAVTLWAGLGRSTDVGRAIVGGICLLFALLGNLMGKVRRNFYIGIRTPWTLANERVWNATHRFAAKTFVLGGIAGLVLTALGLNGIPVVAVLLIAAFIPVVYSLVFYKQLERRGELQG
ncbi:MAG TPA: SdpI family protein [Candidatus Acidoferrum sp.]|nr:SdpI family protein [Candidatus Acidoferrum sp.]